MKTFTLLSSLSLMIVASHGYLERVTEAAVRKCKLNGVVFDCGNTAAENYFFNNKITSKPKIEVMRATIQSLNLKAKASGKFCTEKDAELSFLAGAYYQYTKNFDE